MTQELCYRCYYPIEKQYIEITDEERNLLSEHYYETEIPPVGEIIWFTLCDQCGLFNHQMGKPTKCTEKTTPSGI